MAYLADEMAQIEVKVNDREYLLACEDGEEDHLAELAKYLNNNVTELVQSVGQVGEARLLLMAGLLIADELFDARNIAQALESEILSAEAAGKKDFGDTIASANNEIERIVTRLDGIAHRLERA